MEEAQMLGSSPRIGDEIDYCAIVGEFSKSNLEKIKGAIEDFT